MRKSKKLHPKSINLIQFRIKIDNDETFYPGSTQTHTKKKINKKHIIVILLASSLHLVFKIILTID